MGFAIAPTPIAKGVVVGGINKLANGNVTLTVGSAGVQAKLKRKRYLPDGKEVMEDCEASDVLSVQPDGTWQTRIAGTDGGYEQGAISGDKITYCPDGLHSFTYSLVKTP